MELNKIIALVKVVKGSTISKLLKITIEDRKLPIHSKKAMNNTKKLNQLTFTDNIG